MYIKADFYIKKVNNVEYSTECIFSIKEKIVMLAGVTTITISGEPFLDGHSFNIVKRELLNAYQCESCYYFDAVGQLAKKFPLVDILFLDKVELSDEFTG